MITIKRTNFENEDFISLVKQLDLDLAIRDGADHGFYAQFNKIDAIKYAVVACNGDMPIGCGAIKNYEEDVMEVKRMYVLPDQRGQGIAALVLTELEKWAKELQCKQCILETGLKQPEAIKLYQKCGYTIIPNYGQYKDVENSVCFEKWI
jgi:putative acetyltransferase